MVGRHGAVCCFVLLLGVELSWSSRDLLAVRFCGFDRLIDGLITCNMEVFG